MLDRLSNFTASRSARPMMARDADSMYWMSRYIERAEHVARLMLVNSNLLIDVGDLASSLSEFQWQSVLTVTRTAAPPELTHSLNNGDLGAIEPKVAKFMTFDAENPSSLLSCVSRARENARSIRENISAEMWEALNSLYWSIQSDDAPARFEDSHDDFYRQIMTGSMLFQGLTDQTMMHDQRWQFAQLAKFLERIDVTARIIETRFGVLAAAESMIEGAMRNIHWMGVLRSCCSIEAYRRCYLGDMDPLHVATFLILESNFPRSIRFSVQKARNAITSIRQEVNPTGVDPAERVLGRLDAQLEYAEIGEMLQEGIPSYLLKIQGQIAEAALAVQKSYFLH
jgi:uncharacterized alpha-E superfamily protein